MLLKCPFNAHLIPLICVFDAHRMPLQCSLNAHWWYSDATSMHLQCYFNATSMILQCSLCIKVELIVGVVSGSNNAHIRLLKCSVDTTLMLIWCHSNAPWMPLWWSFKDALLNLRQCSLDPHKCSDATSMLLQCYTNATSMLSWNSFNAL